MDQEFGCPPHCGPLHILFVRLHEVVLWGDIVAGVELRDPREVSVQIPLIYHEGKTHIVCTPGVWLTPGAPVGLGQLVWADVLL